MLSLIKVNTIKAKELKEGMFIYNIGRVSALEFFNTSNFVRFICVNERIMSCAYFWYRADTDILIKFEDNHVPIQST
jgi:hypothetical protein